MRPWALTLILTAGWLGIGCEGPCRALSVRVCECSPSPREEAACIRRLDQNQAQRPAPTRAEEEHCEALLDTCTCQALELGRVDQCGLSQDFRFSDPAAAE